jgi:hypothetical protein
VQNVKFNFKHFYFYFLHFPPGSSAGKSPHFSGRTRGRQGMGLGRFDGPEGGAGPALGREDDLRSFTGESIHRELDLL